MIDDAGERPLEESKKLCAFLLEKGISQMPEGCETLLGIFDLRGFGHRNADFGFVRFLVRLCIFASHCCAAASKWHLLIAGSLCHKENWFSMQQTNPHHEEGEAPMLVERLEWYKFAIC